MIFSEVLNYSIKPLLGGFLIFFIILAGAFVLLIDRKELQAAGKKKDAKLAKLLGISYIVAGPILYLIGRII
ncbi:CLC_0170 family protein [Proteiniborus sp.]|uniref:CLC_0170 family protein n=1 Tax=Proteiniborus sp. TaxID=2079015 RepID=UPI003328551C